MRLLLRGAAAFLATMPWPTMRRCRHEWNGERCEPRSCERCGQATP